MFSYFSIDSQLRVEINSNWINVNENFYIDLIYYYKHKIGK